MRRVVTGDQLAQLRNHDPFAVPVWRAPVYRTPLGFVALIQAARLLGRLIRFLFRHPVAVLVLIVTVLLWRVIGWAGLTVLAASTAVALAVWRWRFPAHLAGTSGRQLVAGGGPGTNGAAGVQS